MKMMHCQAGKTLGKGNKSNKTSTATTRPQQQQQEQQDLNSNNKTSTTRATRPQQQQQDLNSNNKTSTATRPATAGNPLDERVGVRCHRKHPSVPPSTVRVDTAGRVKQYPVQHDVTCCQAKHAFWLPIAYHSRQGNRLNEFIRTPTQ